MTSPATVPHQAAIGLGLAAAIVAGWAGLHVWSVFFLTVDLRTAALVPVVMLLLCWLSVGMFISAHDAMHGSLAPGYRRTNVAIGGFVLALYAGFGWRLMRDAHMDHHRHSGTDRDPDFDAGHPDAFWPWYATFLRRYFGWRSMAYVGTVVLGYWWLGAAPANILLFYGVPAIASSFQLFYFGTYRPHRHEATGFVDTHRARSSDFGAVASLASCFHFGYHHEHHLSPHVPWWRLPARHRTGQAGGENTAGLRT